jgi:Ni/Co efflux regulator RcnB
MARPLGKSGVIRRLLITLSALVVVAAAPLHGSLAEARERGGDRGHQGGGRGHDGDRRGPPDRRGPDRRYEGRRYEDRGEFRREFAPRRAFRVRPGGFLPPSYRGAILYDYQRFRLRPPPHGYAWFVVGNDFLLVSLIDGRIYDVIVN